MKIIFIYYSANIIKDGNVEILEFFSLDVIYFITVEILLCYFKK